MTTENENNNGEQKITPKTFMWMYIYFAYLLMFFAVMCVCIYYGWIHIRDEATLTKEQLYLMILCGTTIALSVITTRYIQLCDTMPKNITNILYWVEIVIIAIFAIVILDICKNPDKSWADVLGNSAPVIAVSVVLLIAYFYLVFRKNPKTGESLDDRWTKKCKDAIKKADAKWREEESRSLRGEINPGYAEVTGDRIAIRTHVKRQTYTFMILLSLISAFVVIGKIWSHDSEIVGGMMALAFILGIALYDMVVYSYIDSAVCKGGISYKEGSKYALLSAFVFSTACLVIYTAVAPSATTTDMISDAFWFAVTDALFFLLTLLVCTIKCKKDGKYSLFNIDGYNKRLKGDD